LEFVCILFWDFMHTFSFREGYIRPHYLYTHKPGRDFVGIQTQDFGATFLSERGVIRPHGLYTKEDKEWSKGWRDGAFHKVFGGLKRGFEPAFSRFSTLGTPLFLPLKP